MDQIDRYLECLDNNKTEYKSSERSEAYKTKGNSFYAKSNYSEAFKHYTLALSYAPSFKSITLAYSNRSAVFNSLKLYKECLREIQTIKDLIASITDAKDLNFLHDGLALKLLKRELSCLKQLNLPIFDLNELNSIFIRFLSEKDYLELKETFQKNFTTENKSAQRTCPQNEKSINPTKISECVDVKYNLSKGRYCIANRDIHVGECLFVEKAYCAILLPEFNESYCQQCFKLIYDVKSGNFLYLNIQVCDLCTSVLYCSSQCKLEDNHKHSFECKLLKSLMHNLGIAHLAYRIVATTDFEILMKFATKNQEASANSNIDYNNSTDYEQIFHLLTHEKVCVLILHYHLNVHSFQKKIFYFNI